MSRIFEKDSLTPAAGNNLCGGELWPLLRLNGFYRLFSTVPLLDQPMHQLQSIYLAP
jgi:hypothetical protein